jgi:hypothetical protein
MNFDLGPGQMARLSVAATQTEGWPIISLPSREGTPQHVGVRAVECPQVLFEREREGKRWSPVPVGCLATSAPGRLYRSTACHGRSSDSALSNRLRAQQRELCETNVGLVVDHLGNIANLNKQDDRQAP